MPAAAAARNGGQWTGYTMPNELLHQIIVQSLDADFARMLDTISHRSEQGDEGMKAYAQYCTTSETLAMLSKSNLSVVAARVALHCDQCVAEYRAIKKELKAHPPDR